MQIYTTPLFVFYVLVLKDFFNQDVVGALTALQVK